MRLAVLADIHGNCIALDRVLKELDEIGIDGIIIAGDHFNDVSQPMEVFQRLLSLDAWIIKGNKEERVLNYHKGKYQDWSNVLQMSSFMWTYRQFDGKAFEYIENLPEQIVIDIPETDKIRVVHGSPFRIDELLYKDKKEERNIECLESIEEKVLICGHSHTQWHKRYKDKLIVNPGSVGCGFNKIGAEYTLLEWDGCKWHAVEKQIEYDKAELEADFIRSGYLSEGGIFAKTVLASINTGRNITMDFIGFAYKLAEERGIKASLVPNDIWQEAEVIWNVR